MVAKAIIYEDRSNPILITLVKNGVTLPELDMNNITKYEIKYQDTYYDSDTYPLAFVDDAPNGQVTIKPYSLGLAASRKKGDLVEFIVYDAADNVGGLLWSQFTLIVKDDAVLTT
jgi:hypothetical protein